MKHRPAIVAKPNGMLVIRDWTQQIQLNDKLVFVTGRTARNPATGQIMKLKDRTDLADVIVNDQKIGRMQWEQEYFPAITFDAANGFESEMLALLWEIALSMDAVVGEYPDDREPI